MKAGEEASPERVASEGDKSRLILSREDDRKSKSRNCKAIA
jgi:hypothetical protein